jgi:hypothetical protein
MWDDAISRLERADFGANLRYDTGGLVTKDMRKRGYIPMPFQNVQVGAAYPAGAGLHEDLVRSKAGYRRVLYQQRRLDRAHNRGFHEADCTHSECAGSTEFND